MNHSNILEINHIFEAALYCVCISNKLQISVIQVHCNISMIPGYACMIIPGDDISHIIGKEKTKQCPIRMLVNILI